MKRALFIPYATTVSWNATYLWQQNLGRYLDHLSSFFGEVSIICHVISQEDKVYIRENRPIYTYQMASDRISVMPFPTGYIKEALSLLSRHIRTADFIYIFLPSYKGIIAALLSLVLQKPYGIYIGANWKEIAPYMFSRQRHRLSRACMTWLVDQLEYVAVRHAAFTIAHGELIVQRLGAQQHRVFPAVPVLNWDQQAFHKRTDTCQNKPINVLYVGTLAPRKGVEYLIQGFALARKHSPELELMLVGIGQPWYEQKLRALVESLGLDTSIRFVGYIAEAQHMLSIYRSADLFVFPTLGEGFPRVLYEALSQGLPVITTKVGSLPTVLADRKTALMVEPRSSEAIAQAITEVRSSAELRRELIQQGYLLAQDRLRTSSPLEQFGGLLIEHVPSFASKINTSSS